MLCANEATIYEFLSEFCDLTKKIENLPLEDFIELISDFFSSKGFLALFSRISSLWGKKKPEELQKKV